MILLPTPPGNNRYYRHFRGMTVLSKEGRAFKSEVARRCKAAGMMPLAGDVALYIIYHPRQNKDGSASKVRLDIDAPLKATMDALNGIGYTDDKQVTRLMVEIGSSMPGGGLSVAVRSASD